MIILSGEPFDISQIINDYTDNSIEGQILHTMADSSEKYRFDSLNQLKFELLMRKETVNAARALNKSRFSFANFHKSKCNPEYWDRMENGGFRLKNGVKPSDAINDIFINGDKYATECATAMVIVFYKALLDIYQEDLFNKTFQEIYLMNWHSIDPKLGDIGVPRKVTDLLLGDRGYFSNPEVDPKTPEWVGENVIILPDELFYGHGIGITTGDRIIRALNDNRKPGAAKTAYLLDSASHPDYKRLADIYYKSNPQPSQQENPSPVSLDIT